MERITYTIERASKAGEKSPKSSPRDLATIIARVRTGEGKQIKHRTPVTIPAALWSGGSIVLPKKTAANYGEAEEAKSRLAEYVAKLEIVVDALPSITGDTLRKAMAAAAGATVDELRQRKDALGSMAALAEDGRSLAEMIRSHAEDSSTTQSAATRAGLKTLAAALERYEGSKGKVYLAAITGRDVQGFARFLAEEGPAGGRARTAGTRSSNTISSMVSRLRTAVNKLAKKHGIPLQSGMYDDTPTQEYTQEPIYLTSDELSTLSAYVCTTEAENAVKRAFLFQCSTGMRFGDLQNLTEIHRDADGSAFVHYVANKTGEQTKVPLSALALQQLGPAGELPKIPSLPTYNAKIKSIMREAGITREVPIVTPGGISYQPICDHGSSHMARRTFVGRLINANVPANVVRAMSGHTEGSKAFSRYYAITDSQKKEALTKLAI